jgi:hypothetical protein
MLPNRVQMYLLQDLAATPEILNHMLSSSISPAIWDRRPDPERFTLREIIAHLADWENVFQERLRQTRDEDQPIFIAYNPAQLALDHDYAHTDPQICLAQYSERRQATLALLHSMTPAQWDRSGRHGEVGPVTATEQAVMMSGHDGYHLRQVVQWMEAP